MPTSVLQSEPLGFPWPCLDPFLFCAHHNDRFPAGTAQLGAAARYGEGDAQWLTTGAGIVHSEMFPLLKRDAPNPADLFQIWLNLPAAKKMAPPAFSMLWAGRQPRLAGEGAELTLVAGRLNGQDAPAPPKDSYAAQAASDLLIAVLVAQPGGRFRLPAAPAGVNRCLYLYQGAWRVDGEAQAEGQRLRLRPEAAVDLQSPLGAELLVLQGRPLGEPVMSYGPFVLNDRPQLLRALEDYQRTGFGGWPWDRDDPVHPADRGRFARHPDGREERP